MKEKNVLIVHNYYQIPGGEDIVVDNERKMLEKYGYNVVFYSRSNSEIEKMNKLKKILLPINLIFNIKTYNDIKKIIEENNINIVHIHNTHILISPSVYYAAMVYKIPIIQTLHNFRILCPNATFYRKGKICEDCVNKGLRYAIKYGCYRNSRIQTLMCVINMKIHRILGVYGKINYICLTKFNKEKILTLEKIEENKIFIKPNFTSSVEKIVLKENRKDRIIFVGRLDELKGVNFLLKAWKQMGNKAPELMICGTGPLEAWCERYTRENQLDTVKLMGFVQHVKTRELIANSKALILPTQWYEGFPMCIIEAFSVGTPVICPDFGNVGDIVSEGITGYKFCLNEYDGLIAALSKIESNEKIYEETHKVFLDLYSENRNIFYLNSIYEEISKKNENIKKNCIIDRKTNN